MHSDLAIVPTVTIKRLIASSPEKIFDLWTQPAKMARWMSPYPGPVQCIASADVRVGGAFKLSMASAASQCDIEGIYVEVQRPNSLIFTWSGPSTQDANTLVTLELKAVKGGTELVLTHEKLPTPEIRQGHIVGWANMFEHLDIEVR
jgi:uncharacterized protein YndB with AHSA1/START domain